MEKIISSIITMSIGGSLTSLILFLIKPLIKDRLTKGFQYYIWLIAIFQLLLPITISLPINTQQSKIPTVGNVVNNYVESFGTENNDPQGEDPTYVLTNNSYKESQWLNKQSIFLIWLVGVTVFLFVNLVGYFRFRYIINKTKISVDKNTLPSNWNNIKRPKLYLSKAIKTPMLVGFINAMIIIPQQEYTEMQLKNILTHEMNHYKRKDIFIKWLLLFANAIHWFNPLIYFVRHEINCACELSCDEAVIAKLTAEEKQAYGNTLLDIATNSNFTVGTLSVTMCEEKRNLRERLVAIMNYKSKSKWIAVLSAVMFVVVSGVALVACSDINNVDTATQIKEITEIPKTIEPTQTSSNESVKQNTEITGPQIVNGSIIKIIDFERGDTCTLNVEIYEPTNERNENSGAIKYKLVGNTALTLPADVLVTYIDYDSDTNTNGKKLINYLKEGGSYFSEPTIAKLIVHTDESGKNIRELEEVYEP